MGFGGVCWVDAWSRVRCCHEVHSCGKDSGLRRCARDDIGLQQVAYGLVIWVGGVNYCRRCIGVAGSGQHRWGVFSGIGKGGLGVDGNTSSVVLWDREVWLHLRFYDPLLGPSGQQSALMNGAPFLAMVSAVSSIEVVPRVSSAMVFMTGSGDLSHGGGGNGVTVSTSGDSQ
ncbi:hypothetical protein NE237_002911 [Protea cynaroides]|uniref:Uncharacterized protein n=1 Tax=Protea cynaroides TaxID=273540 RepID=A0A9Q0KFY7_9MAGN|nr:hypothetical protein NE237_002911 [Protea cynaroides]